MKVIVALVLVLGLTIAQTTYDESQIHDMVMKLKKSEYGRNILTTIQLEAASGTDESTLKRINTMLSELLEGIQNEVTELVQEKGRKKGWCAGKIDELEATLGKLGIDINEKLASIPPIEANRDSKVADMKDKEQEISIRRDDLRQIEEINEEERQDYFQTRDEHDNLITELNKAKAIIAQIRKNNFLEKKEHQTVLAQLADHSTEALNRISNAPKKSLFSFVMNLAQQVGIQADQDQVKKVIAIIDELIAEEEYAQQIEFEAENIRLERYEFDAHRVQNAIEDLDTSIQIRTAEVQNINLGLVESKSDIATLEESQKHQNAELEQSQTECEDSIKAKESAIQAYREEEDLISEVIALLSSEAVRQIDRELSN